MSIRIGNYYYGVEASRHWGCHIVITSKYQWLVIGPLCFERWKHITDSEWDTIAREWRGSEEDKAWADL